MESNQKVVNLTAEQAMIQRTLAQRALSLNEKRCDLGTRLDTTNKILQDLDGLAVLVAIEFPTHVADQVSEEWFKNHPITRLLLFRLKFEVLIDPDCNYLKTRSQLERMLSCS